MSSKKLAPEFPDVEAKLQKPTKQSAFERQKAEAEAKRLRDAAETAAVYEDFVKSFDADEHGRNEQGLRGGSNHHPGGRGGFASRGGGGGGGGPGRRHFGGSGGLGMKSSGPGTLGPAPPAFGGKKRPFFDAPTSIKREFPSSGRLGFANENENDDDAAAADERGALPAKKSLARVFDASDDDDDDEEADNGNDDEQRRAGGGLSRSEDKAIAKPTLRLANLPPATSPAVIKALLPRTLNVQGVKILAPPPPAATNTTAAVERRALTAIVTLSADTAASELDAVVSALQNRYLGLGHYLSLHRHLSSAVAAQAGGVGVAGGAQQHAFGAKPVPAAPTANKSRGQDRFAPPSSYALGGSGGAAGRNLLHVPVSPPRDIKQLRMIHKVVEGVLEHGPEFEALLMSRPDVQREEKWAWIWDARSQGGVWYRWRLWEILTGGNKRREKYVPLFEGSHAWKVPEKQLPYEYTTGVDGFVSDSEYDSEFDDEDEEDGKVTAEGSKGDEETFLNPIEKAKLVHLLARLPTTLSKIRKGDIARITSFAITHSNRGANEIVDLIVANIESPLAFTSANPDYRPDAAATTTNNNNNGDSRDASPDSKPTAGNQQQQQQQQQHQQQQDMSGAKLVALYAISDILSSSSTSGIRHAWRYRQLLDAALTSRRVFEGLGAMPEKMNWGRLRAEKWKRSVGLVLSLWDGWCVFPNDSQEQFVREFENPPSVAAAKREEEKALEDGEKTRGKWKTVEAAAAANEETVPEGGEAAAVDSDGSYDEYTDDEEMDNELLARYHIDGESLLDIDIVGVAIDGDFATRGGQEKETQPPPAQEPRHQGSQEGSSGSARGFIGGKRKRMTAADMFADSDEDGS